MKNFFFTHQYHSSQQRMSPLYIVIEKIKLELMFQAVRGSRIHLPLALCKRFSSQAIEHYFSLK